MLRKLLTVITAAVGFTALMTTAAYAYVDPTTTTFLAQAIAGVAAVVGSAAVFFWRRAKKKISARLGIDEDRNKEREEDFAVVGRAESTQADDTAEETQHDVAEQG